jgi:two-component system chemotaxis response regulator CheB
LIPSLPADLALPVAVVLHMPVGYTELYARKLDEISSVRVVEATYEHHGGFRLRTLHA